MPTPTVEVDLTRLRDYLQILGQADQLDYGVAVALNSIANRVQKAVRGNIQGEFNLTRTDWVLKRVYIGKPNRATKRKPWVDVEINEPRDVMTKHEDGGQKIHHNGKAYFVIPNPKVFRRAIRASNPLHIRNLKFQETPQGRQGNLRTFMVTSKKSGCPIIVQRTSKLSADRKRKYRGTGTRWLYVLVREVSLRPRLEFVHTATGIATSMDASADVAAAVQKVLDTAR